MRSLDILLTLVPAAKWRSFPLSLEEAFVLSLVNGKLSVRDVLETSGLSRERGMEVLKRLIDFKVIALSTLDARTESFEVASQAPSIDGEDRHTPAPRSNLPTELQRRFNRKFNEIKFCSADQFLELSPDFDVAMVESHYDRLRFDYDPTVYAANALGRQNQIKLERIQGHLGLCYQKVRALAETRQAQGRPPAPDELESLDLDEEETGDSHLDAVLRHDASVRIGLRQLVAKLPVATLKPIPRAEELPAAPTPIAAPRSSPLHLENRPTSAGNSEEMRAKKRVASPPQKAYLSGGERSQSLQASFWKRATANRKLGSRSWDPEDATSLEVEPDSGSTATANQLMDGKVIHRWEMQGYRLFEIGMAFLFNEDHRIAAPFLRQAGAQLPAQSELFSTILEQISGGLDTDDEIKWR